jgi:hypothetical protein
MHFVKEIRGNTVKFDLIGSEEPRDINIVEVEVTLPGYGRFKRGELYTANELNLLVLAEIDKSLTPLDIEPRWRAKKLEPIKIRLTFKKKMIEQTPPPPPVQKPKKLKKPKSMSTRKSSTRHTKSKYTENSSDSTIE